MSPFVFDLCEQYASVTFMCRWFMHLVPTQKKLDEIKKQVNKDFESICDRFVDNKLSVHFAEDKTNDSFWK